MAKLQDRYKVYEEREGLIEVGHLPMLPSQRAVGRTLITMDRAVALFERALERLGERAWIDPEGGETRRRLYLRDAEHPAWLLPTPLLEHAWLAGIGEVSLGGFINSGAVNPVDAPDDWKPGDPDWAPRLPDPDILPQNEDMRGGSLKISDGPGYAEVRYDDRGLRAETCWSEGGDTFHYARYYNVRPWAIDPLSRPPTPMPFALALRPELKVGGNSVDELLQWVMELQPEARQPHRVLLPLPIPGGVSCAWSRAQDALRDAAFDGRLRDEDQGWVVIDAFEGKAMAVGPDLPTAHARWREVVAALRPRPPRPARREQPEQPVEEHEPQLIRDEAKKAVLLSSGTIHLESPVLAELAWPIPLPQHVPAVAVPIPPLPPVPEHYRQAGFTRMLRMVSAHGQITHAAMREEPGGFILVGEGVLDIVDPETIGAEAIAAVDEQRAWYDDLPEDFPNPFNYGHTGRIHVFRAWDDVRRRRDKLAPLSASWSDFLPHNLDGHRCAWAVTRVWR